MAVFTRRGIVKPPYNPRLERYWHQRRHLFSRYEEGIKIDDPEAWYSVTPEAVAKASAELIAQGAPAGGALFVDAFVGVGGNAIQQALADPAGFVIAIDLDPSKVAMAKHNASIYGVAERIDFVVGDASQLLPHMRAHVCLLSPPWGGIADVAHPPNAPSHSSAFRLTQLAQPCCGLRLFDLAARCAPSIAYYLPADTAEDELARLAMRHTSHICDKVGMRWGGGKRKSARVRAILAVFHARPPAWLVGAMQGATTAVHSRSWDVATDAD